MQYLMMLCADRSLFQSFTPEQQKEGVAAYMEAVARRSSGKLVAPLVARTATWRSPKKRSPRSIGAALSHRAPVGALACRMSPAMARGTARTLRAWDCRRRSIPSAAG
jgi:hypothetical protein